MFSKLYKLIQPALYKMNTIKISPSDLLFLQIFDGEYCHPDTVVKYLYIENYYGKNDFGKELYIKQQFARGKLRNAAALTNKFDNLIKSIEDNGFDTDCALGVDKNFYLRDGSHRSALSLYHNIDTVSVNYLNMEYPRNYRYSWFEEHGFGSDEITAIKEKAAEIMDAANAPLNIVIFGSSAEEADEAVKQLQKYGAVHSCTQYYPTEPECCEICKNLFDASDLYGNKNDVKIEVKNPRFAVIRLKLHSPAMTTVENNELKIFRHFINYRLPVISQAKDIRCTLTDNTFIKDSMLFIPRNFYQNKKFEDIINQYKD
ncbi:MAG: hypothetical protein IJO54_02275 [Oscillospiraceae bacterium]|nr:hypothetical protein [Oscillospiraceae bacterium]